MKKVDSIDIIIPTYNNWELLAQCVNSITSLRYMYPVNVLVVNNGHPDSCNGIGETEYLKVIQTGGKNLGWEGGLKEGLKHSKSEFVIFMNDDAYVPPSSNDWIRKIMEMFYHPDVGAVGPSSNTVMGAQNIWKLNVHQKIETSFLIGFCMAVRRKALDAVGGIDDSLPGGDDLDLSIRLRNAGWRLVIRRDIFVFHHGFVTGSQLYGGSNQKGGWNSREMTERTDHALIRKHGFRKWFECRMGLQHGGLKKGDGNEDKIVASFINCEHEDVIDLGCANSKTLPKSIGVDMTNLGS